MSISDEQIQTRLAELRREAQMGEGRLREVLQEETALRETLLRISGAVQVLEELQISSSDPTSAVSEQPVGNGNHPGPTVLTVP